MNSFTTFFTKKSWKWKENKQKLAFWLERGPILTDFCQVVILKLLSRKTRAKFVKMFKTRKKFVKYELVRQQELEFDVDFRVNSSESFNHEKFSISFQFDEFFRILNLKLTQNSQILSDFWSSCNFEAFEVEKLAKMFKTRPFRQFRQFRHFYTLILTWCPGM